MILSHEHFMLLATIGTAAVATWWATVDSFRLRRSLKVVPRTAWVRDRIFGSVIGIATGLAGVVGIALYYLR